MAMVWQTVEECSGEPEAVPDPQRLLVEICCSEGSKLGDASRKAAIGCKLRGITVPPAKDASKPK